MKTEGKITKGQMTDQLVAIDELMELLGYVDERSVENWCKKNKFPILHIGKKTYTISTFLDLFISQKLEAFVTANYNNPDEIMKAVKENNKEELSKRITSKNIKETVPLLKTIENSDAANNFMTKLKAA